MDDDEVDDDEVDDDEVDDEVNDEQNGNLNEKIEFLDDEIEVIVEVVKKETELYSYDEEKASMIQKFLDDYDSKKQKNKIILRNIEKEIDFYFDLKDIHTDNFGNLKKKVSLNYKPIIEDFLDGNYENNWVNIITNERKKIYIENDDGIDDSNDTIKLVKPEELENYIFSRDNICKSSSGLGNKLNNNDIFEKLPDILKNFNPYENMDFNNHASYLTDNINQNSFSYRNCINNECICFYNDKLSFCNEKFILRSIDGAIYTYDDEEKKIGDKTKIQLITTNQNILIPGDKVNVVGLLLNPSLFESTKSLDDRFTLLKDLMEENKNQSEELINCTKNLNKKLIDSDISFYEMNSNSELEINQLCLFNNNGKSVECIIKSFNDDLITIKEKDSEKLYNLPRKSISLSYSNIPKFIDLDLKNNKTIVVTFKEENSNDLSKNEYKNILEKVIPTFQDIYNINFKKFDKIEKLSDINHITYPYKLTFNDLHFEDMKIIGKILEKKKYKDESKNEEKNISNHIIEYIDDFLLEELENFYGDYPYYNSSFDSDSTRLKWIDSYHDKGRYYRLIQAKKNLIKFIEKIHTPDTIKIEKIKFEKTKESICKENVIAKIYDSLEKLESDNNKDVFYDKAFDNTLIYLKHQIKELHSKPPQKSLWSCSSGGGKTKKKYETNKIDVKSKKMHKKIVPSMITLKDALRIELEKLHFSGNIDEEIENIEKGGRFIEDDNYALLKENDNLKLFVRKNKIWEEITDNELLINVIKSSKMLCKFKNEKLDSIDLEKFKNKCLNYSNDEVIIYTKNNLPMSEDEAASLSLGKQVFKDNSQCLPIREAIKKSESVYQKKLEELKIKIGNIDPSIFDKPISKLKKINKQYKERENSILESKKNFYDDLLSKKIIIDKSKLSFTDVINYCKEFGDSNMKYLLREFDEYDTFTSVLQTGIANTNNDIDIINEIDKIENDEYFKLIKIYLSNMNIKLGNLRLLSIVNQLKNHEKSLRTDIEFNSLIKKKVEDKSERKQFFQVNKVLYVISRIFIEFQLGIENRISSKILKCKTTGQDICSLREHDEISPFLNLEHDERTKISEKKSSDFPCIDYLICILFNISKNEYNRFKKSKKQDDHNFYSCLKGKDENVIKSFFKKYVIDWLQVKEIKELVNKKMNFLKLKENLPKIELDKWEGFKPSLYKENSDNSNIIYYLDEIKNKFSDNNKILLQDTDNNYGNLFFEELLNNDSKLLYNFNTMETRLSIGKILKKNKKFFSITIPEDELDSTKIFSSEKNEDFTFAEKIKQNYCYQGLAIGEKNIFDKHGNSINCGVNKKTVDSSSVNIEKIKNILRISRILNSFKKNYYQFNTNYFKIKSYLNSLLKLNILKKKQNQSIKSILDSLHKKNNIDETFDRYITENIDKNLIKIIDFNLDNMFFNDGNIKLDDRLSYEGIQSIDSIKYLVVMIAKSIFKNNSIDSDFLKLLNISNLELQKKIKNSWKNKITIDSKNENKYLNILYEICSIISPYKKYNVNIEKNNDTDDDTQSDSNSDSDDDMDSDDNMLSNNDNMDSDDIKNISLYDIRPDSNNDIFDSNIFRKFSIFIVGLILTHLTSKIDSNYQEKLLQNYSIYLKEDMKFFDISNEKITFEIEKKKREERIHNIKKEDTMNDDDRLIHKTKKHLGLIEFKSDVSKEIEKEELQEDFMMAGGQDDDVAIFDDDK